MTTIAAHLLLQSTITDLQSAIEKIPILASPSTNMHRSKTYRPNLNVSNPALPACTTCTFTYTLGKKVFELSNHLGNVLTTISDRRISETSGGTLLAYHAQILSSQDYYPFGMQMPGRSFSSEAYRFGFNGKEKDDEVYGVTGSFQDYGFRMYDTRIVRFISVDPLTSKFPELTPFQFASNTPIWAIDLDGLEAWPLSETNSGTQKGFQRHIISSFNAYLSNPKSIDVQTDCANFQFFLMTKYYESTGQRLVFTGKNGKTYDTHAQDSKGNYIYSGFESFFNSAKHGVSTYYLINGGGGLTRKKESSELLVSGDMFIYWFGQIGHAQGLVIDGEQSYMFYGSGLDIYSGNCPDCRTDYYQTDVSGLESSNYRFSWSFLDQLPADEEIQKMTPIGPKELQIDKPVETLQPR